MPLSTTALLALLAAPADPAVRIGLVADTQFNTVHAHRTMYRRGLVDRLWFDVAIRPPSLDYTSHYLLRSIVAQLVKVDRVEMIVFLGDGANNGCRDELIGPRPPQPPGDPTTLGILTVLRELRTEHKVPIYFVIGNHDILGAGNMAFNQRARRHLCHEPPRERPPTDSPLARLDNRPLSKLEVMAEVHRFNAENHPHGVRDGRWEYTDNWDLARLTAACGGPRRQHKRRGCFLAGAVVDRARRFELLLVDSTDFRDVHFLRTVFAGARGAVSWRTERSQIAWFERWTKDAADAAPRGRVVMSHYPIAAFAPFLARKAGHLARLFRPGRNLWVSAHTHTAEPIDHDPLEHARPRVSTPLRELNVGSATDWPSYGVAAVFRVAADGGVELDRTSRRYGAFPDHCRDTLADLDRQIAPGRYRSLPRHNRGLGLFGLDIAVDWTFTRKEYRARRWTAAHDRTVRQNIDTYLTSLPEADRPRAGACIAMYAAIIEGVKQGGPRPEADTCADPSADAPACKEIADEMTSQSAESDVKAAAEPAGKQASDGATTRGDDPTTNTAGDVAAD